MIKIKGKEAYLEEPNKEEMLLGKFTNNNFVIFRDWELNQIFKSKNLDVFGGVSMNKELYDFLVKKGIDNIYVIYKYGDGIGQSKLPLKTFEYFGRKWKNNVDPWDFQIAIPAFPIWNNGDEKVRVIINHLFNKWINQKIVVENE